MAKVLYKEYEHQGKVYDKHLYYFCPGCDCYHYINPDRHKFNGNYDKPTFMPSLLQNWDPIKICHSFITDGKIQYLGDCWHHLKNQTVDLPEINS